MILSAGQPGYLPWLGAFAKMAQCGLWCVFDAVQMTRHDWVTRNHIKTQHGPLMLSVPVHGGMDKRICDVEIVASNWARKHMRSIELAYRKAPFFEQHYAGVGAILDLYADGGLLVELNIDLLRYFMRALGIQVPLVRASDYRFAGAKSSLVLDMCKRLGASEYIFGGEGESYADQEAFRNAGVAIRFHVYDHPRYSQLHGEFIPRLSILDLLMLEGQHSLAIVLNQNTTA